jgi:hypothetical protein
LVPEESGQVYAPSPFVLAEPSDEPELPPEETTIPDDSTPAVTATTLAPTDTTIATDVVTDDTEVIDDEVEDDTFSQGWFSDKAAIPHAIGWGIALFLVGLGAYFAGKAAKRLYVCFLVGFVPFVIVMYFFFENVNRLLPPGL